MNYEELLANINSNNFRNSRTLETPYVALREVLESVKDTDKESLIIETIAKELQ